MKGIELCEKFYIQHGEPMLREKFGSLLPLLAVGIMGSGSECFGYDDEISRDHDFEPGFCIFIPDEIDSRAEFALERAYSKLPSELEGFKRTPLSPVGGNRHGVIRISDFFKSKTGNPKGELALTDWLFVPEQSLAEATNGKIFYDGYGALTKIRKGLEYLPEDIRLKRLAGALLMMAQAGQYNYPRCIKRGETGSAQLAIIEFAKSAMSAIFLLNKRYIPYYKWTFRALRELSVLSHLECELEMLISTKNDTAQSELKQSTIEKICSQIALELRAQGLTSLDGSELEMIAYSVNDKITDNSLRNMHILSAILN